MSVIARPTSRQLSPYSVFQDGFTERFFDDFVREFGSIAESFGRNLSESTRGSRKNEKVEPYQMIPRTSGWPSMNVVEKEDRFEVSTEIPGMNPNEINLELRGDNLVISGERSEEKSEKTDQRHVYERRYGSFQRFIPLCDGVTSDGVTARYENGVLYVTVQKPEIQETNRIPITIDTGPSIQSET